MNLINEKFRYTLNLIFKFTAITGYIAEIK